MHILEHILESLKDEILMNKLSDELSVRISNSFYEMHFRYNEKSQIRVLPRDENKIEITVKMSAPINVINTMKKYNAINIQGFWQIHANNDWAIKILREVLTH